MNLHPAQQTAVHAARAAGQLMRRNLRAPKKVNTETSHDIKLELDVRCQKLIERILHRAFPAIAFLGEEETSRSSGKRSHSAGALNADFRWVVDPIDGTVNFASGIPHAAVSIALQERVSGARGQVSGEQRSRKQHETRNTQYETVLGVVYDPFQDELWTAFRGGPARLNGKPVHVSGRRHLGQCIVSIGFAKSRGSLNRALPCFAWLARRVRKIRMLGSAALGLTYVATGRLDAYIERGVNIWDVAAGGFIIERAGGKFWRELVGPGQKIRMIASNGRIHDQLPIPR